MSSPSDRDLVHRTRSAGKTYQFDREHPPDKPADMWFQDSHEGLVLFLVFYTFACRWTQCLGCNLPSKSSPVHINYRQLMSQIDSVFSSPEVLSRRDEIKKIILSNNGSVLDEQTFSSTALMYFLALLNSTLPRVEFLTIESRPEYVDLAELEFIARALAEAEFPTQLELAVGFEAFDDHIRNSVFRKGLDIVRFEQLTEDLARYGYHLKCYFMQKPVPYMSDADGIEDIRKAIEYLSQLAVRHRLNVNLHLNPTFVAAQTPLAEAFRLGRYSPPQLKDVAAAALHAENSPVTLFIGLSDEDLSVPGGSFLREGEESIVKKLDLFNRTQDYSILKEIVTS